MNRAHLISSCKKHEGCRLESYLDTKGIWTIGYGRNLEAMYPGRKNFQGLAIMQATADKWFEEDIEKAIAGAQTFPEYKFLDVDPRQNAFIEMVFNMGARKLIGFVKMMTAIRLQKWGEAAEQALDSDWHKQVGKRAEVLADMLRTGKFPE